jgi:hypothetical protein
MGEIVDQLRSVASYGAPDCHVLYEAADEIERLREALEAICEERTALTDTIVSPRKIKAYKIARAALHTDAPKPALTITGPPIIKCATCGREINYRGNDVMHESKCGFFCDACGPCHCPRHTAPLLALHKDDPSARTGSAEPK